MILLCLMLSATAEVSPDWSRYMTASSECRMRVVDPATATVLLSPSCRLRRSKSVRVRLKSSLVLKDGTRVEARIWKPESGPARETEKLAALFPAEAMLQLWTVRGEREMLIASVGSSVRELLGIATSPDEKKFVIAYTYEKTLHERGEFSLASDIVGLAVH